MKKIYKLIDMLFIFMIISDLGSVLQIFNIDKFNPLVIFLKIIIYGIMIIRLCIIKPKRIWYRACLLYIFLGYCIFNTIISNNVSESVQTLMYILLNTAYAYMLYSEYSMEEVLEIIMIPLCLITVMSIAVAILMPKYGQYFDTLYKTYAWKGIFSHKNTLGAVSGLTIIIALVMNSFKRIKYRYLFFAALAIVNLYFSYSHSPAYIIILLLIYMLVKKLLKKEFAFSIFSITLLVDYIYLFKYNFLQYFINGDILDFSGRRSIYDIIITLINDRPYLGYGLTSAWMEKGGVAAIQTNKYLNFNPNSCHSGILEIILQLGYVGLTIYLLLIGSIFISCAKAYVKNEKSNKLILIMLYILLISVFESNLAEFKSIYWLLQIYILFQFDKREKSKFKVEKTLINV